jgi:PKD domain/Divergent InlB B-repeat domain
MRSKIFGALLVVCAVSAVTASPAGAIVANTPTGRVSYLPLNGQAAARAIAPLRAAASRGAAEPSGEPPLLYSEEEGPVMHSSEAFAVFWVPSGGEYSFPAGYTTAIEAYLQNVAADSGKPTNVYSVDAQYTDSSGQHASYNDSYGGSVTDTHAYPTSGTCPKYSGKEAFTACITDAKLEDQVEAVVAEQGWPTTGLNAEYYVVLPPHVGSCFTSAGTQCFDKQFCAYHSFSDPLELIYANISYAPGDHAGCGVSEYPNGHANGNVDDTLSNLSHEANESITDPLLNAWFDENGEEIADKCRNTGDDYGSPLGGSAVEHTLFNETIGANDYYLQREWSNDIEGCAQRVDPAVPVIADPGEVAPHESVLFDGSGSLKGSGKIVSYTWEFEGGGTVSGSSSTTFHEYAEAGTFGVTLTAEDDGGFTYSTERKVTVAENPQRILIVTLAGSGLGKVSGPGISCPPECSHEYANGESVTLTATPAPGSTFTGWSGGGCSGTGACEVTMSVKQNVTATFTGPPPPPSEGGSTAGGTPSGGSPLAPAPAPVAPKKALKCRKGFREARKHGKAVCVKVKKHRGRR